MIGTTTSATLGERATGDQGDVPAAHTPGPWKVESFGSPRVIANDEKGEFPICDIRGWGHLTGKGHGALGLSNEEGAAIQDANARLIAAAPTMREYIAKRAASGDTEASQILESIDADR